MAMADRDLIEDKKNNQCLITNKSILLSSNARVQDRFFWFAAYDKLINTKNMHKVIKYFSATDDKQAREIVKEQAIILKDFEIYFDIPVNSTKPYIRAKKVY